MENQPIKKRKLAAYTVQDKLRFIDIFYQCHSNYSQTAKLLKVHPSVIFRVVKQKELLAANAAKNKCKLTFSNKSYFPALELKLNEWIETERRLTGNNVKYIDLIQRARVIAASENDPLKYANFKFSVKWAKNFVRRFGWSSKAITHKSSEHTKSPDEKACQVYWEQVPYLLLYFQIYYKFDQKEIITPK